MKVITDYFTSPATQIKKSAKSRKNVSLASTKVADESTTEALFNDDGEEVYYATRKIKIRLADPNVPDSYVCEIYDSSLDEEVHTPASEESPKNMEPKKEDCKSVFDVLMTGSQKQQKKPLVKKRPRSKKSCDIDESGSSSDEALILVKKKLKACNEMVEESAEQPVSRRARTRSQPDSSSVLRPANPERKQSLTRVGKRSTIASYFNVSESPLETKKDSPEKAEESPDQGPRKKNTRSSRRSKRAVENKKVPKESESEPKRAAENKTAPKKSEVEQKAPRRHSIRTGENDDTPIIIRELSVKLPKLQIAPLFLKQPKKVVVVPKKAVVDPEVIKAREKFLQLGLPTSMRKKAENLKAQENEEVPFFPTVAHIQQRGNELVWTKRSIELELKIIDEYTPAHVAWKTLEEQKSDLKVGCGQKEKQLKAKDLNIDRLKPVYKSIDLDCLFSSLKKKKERAVSNDVQVWSDKYQPGSKEIVSNEKTVAKLGKWLAAWKVYGESLLNGTARRKPSDGGSSDDFVSSDEDESVRAPVTACLLQGPTGSGKTALIHALAAELDFHILEINCSSKRSGKKMLADLQEATQSHKILQEANGVVSRSAPGSGKDGMAVIVVEEADIVFEEQDDGFISGLLTLVSSAKRPVLLLTSDASVPHLDKFRTSHTLQLSMVRPKLSAACAVLELVSILEGVLPPRSALLRMLGRNNQDLRRSLLELQFWLQRGEGKPHAWNTLNAQPLTADHVWWNSHQLIFQHDLWHSDPSSSFLMTRNSDVGGNEEETERTNSNKSPNRESNLGFENFLRYSENLSDSDVLGRQWSDENSELDYCKARLQDSSSLNENWDRNSYSEMKLRKDIEEDFLERSARCFQARMGLPQKQDSCIAGIPTKEARWLSGRRKAMDELLTVVPCGGSTARHCDYLPALRTICRTEQRRVTANTKRRNRFYHYLRTLGASPTEANLLINCDTFPCDYLPE